MIIVLVSRLHTPFKHTLRLFKLYVLVLTNKWLIYLTIILYNHQSRFVYHHLLCFINTKSSINISFWTVHPIINSRMIFSYALLFLYWVTEFKNVRLLHYFVQRWTTIAFSIYFLVDKIIFFFVTLQWNYWKPWFIT